MKTLRYEDEETKTKTKRKGLMVELLYALNEEGRMVHVNEVPNGISCRCHCPSCSAPLVAKNNGETMAPHFAHASGTVCSGAHESELHLLAKRVISEDKAVMLPRYGNVYQGGLVRFDTVEVEERNDISSLQPDLCGVVHNKTTGKDSRLWIEIMVTHAIGPEKRALIRKNEIACIEINLSQFMSRQVTREELRDFILQEQSGREWTNNPVLEKQRLTVSATSRNYAERKTDEDKALLSESMSAYEMKEHYKGEQQAYLANHEDCCIMDGKDCYRCKHHTTRKALFEETKRLHLPAWVREALSGNLLYWTHDNVKMTVNHNQCYRVHYEGFLHLLPTSSPDIHGRIITPREIKQNEQIIPFLLDTVPAIIASEGLKCQHNVQSFPSLSTKYNIACNMPNVVNRHRRRK